MKQVILLLLFISCNAQKGNLNVNSKNTNNGELELILRDNYSGLKSPKILVVKEPTALREFYAQINKTRKPGLAIPNLDFNAEMVIVYCAGEQINASAPSMAIEHVNNESIQITIIDFEIRESSRVSTSPFCMYKLKASNKDVTFEKQ